MRQIPLINKSKLHLGEYVTLVDDDDYEWLIKWDWHVHVASNANYVRRHEGKRTVLMHREIMNPENRKVLIDHKDHDGLNNQKANLRKCSSSDNMKNRRGRGTSMYLGVCFHKKRRKWIAKIQVAKKLVELGEFINEIDAAKAYDKAAKQHHKEFANLNFS